MRNDRAKGIIRTNVTAPLSKRRQAASTEATEEEVECATAEATLQYDAFNLLNQFSAWRSPISRTGSDGHGLNFYVFLLLSIVF